MDKRQEGNEILAGILSAHQNLFAACRRLYEWVQEDAANRQIAISILVDEQYLEEEAAKKIDRYTLWGSGDIDPRFFELPAGIRERICDFKERNVNKLFTHPMVAVAIHEEAEDIYTEHTAHFRALDAATFDAVFTETGERRSPAKQEEIARNATPPKEFQVKQGQVYLRAGQKSATVLNEALRAIGEACTSEARIDSMIAEVTTTLHELSEVRKRIVQDKAHKSKLKTLGAA